MAEIVLLIIMQLLVYYIEGEWTNISNDNMYYQLILM